MPIFRIRGSDEATGAIYHPFSGGKKAIYNRLCALAGEGSQEGNARFFASRNMDILQKVAYAPQGPPRSFAQLRERLSKNWLLRAYAKDPTSFAEVAEIDPHALSDLQTTLRPFANSFSEGTGTAGFTIEDSRHAIFSLAATSAGAEARMFVNMLIEDIKDAMMSRITRPCFWIIDEFLVLNNESIKDLLTVGRSRGVRIIVAMQSIDAVTEDKTREAFLTNCRTKIFMGQDKPETLAKLAGTKKGIESSIQQDEGESTGMGSSRLQDQYLIDPNDIRSLKKGECFLLRQQKAARLVVLPLPTVRPHGQAELRIKKQTEPAPHPHEEPTPPPADDDDDYTPVIV